MGIPPQDNRIKLNLPFFPVQLSFNRAKVTAPQGARLTPLHLSLSSISSAQPIHHCLPRGQSAATLSVIRDEKRLTSFSVIL